MGHRLRVAAQMRACAAQPAWIVAGLSGSGGVVRLVLPVPVHELPDAFQRCRIAANGALNPPEASTTGRCCTTTRSGSWPAAWRSGCSRRPARPARSLASPPSRPCWYRARYPKRPLPGAGRFAGLAGQPGPPVPARGSTPIGPRMRAAHACAAGCGTSAHRSVMSPRARPCFASPRRGLGYRPGPPCLVLLPGEPDLGYSE